MYNFGVACYIKTIGKGFVLKNVFMYMYQ